VKSEGGVGESRSTSGFAEREKKGAKRRDRKKVVRSGEEGAFNRRGTEVHARLKNIGHRKWEEEKRKECGGVLKFVSKKGRRKKRPKMTIFEKFPAKCKNSRERDRKKRVQKADLGAKPQNTKTGETIK